MIDLIAYISMAGVIIGYYLTDKYGKWTMDVANAIFFLPLMLTAFYYGAFAAGVLNLFFGLIAIKGLRK